MSDLKVNVTTEGNELVIRQGDAAPIIDNSQTYASKGRIENPHIYAVHKGKAIDMKIAIVHVNRSMQSIELACNPEDKTAHKIGGQIKSNTEFTKFGINDNKKYSPKQLAELCKMNRIYFPSVDDNMALVSNLKNLSVKVDQAIERGGDDVGNKNESLLKKVSSNVPESFTLAMPLHEGAEPVTFLVNICLEERDGGISLWLQSVEANELIMKYRDNILDSQLEKLLKLGFLILEI